MCPTQMYACVIMPLTQLDSNWGCIAGLFHSADMNMQHLLCRGTPNVIRQCFRRHARGRTTPKISEQTNIHLLCNTGFPTAELKASTLFHAVTMMPCTSPITPPLQHQQAEELCPYTHQTTCTRGTIHQQRNSTPHA